MPCCSQQRTLRHRRSYRPAHCVTAGASLAMLTMGSGATISTAAAALRATPLLQSQHRECCCLSLPGRSPVPPARRSGISGGMHRRTILGLLSHSWSW